MATSEKESRTLELIKSYARGFVKGNTVDTLGAPVDLINELIVRPVATLAGVGSKVSDKPVGGSKFFRELFSQAVEDSNSAETVGSMVSAGGAAKTAIVLPAFLTKSIKDIKRAEKYIEAGADMEKVEENLGVFKLPASIDDGVMRTVLDDSSAKLNFRESLLGTGLARKQSIVGPEGPTLQINVPVGEVEKLPNVLNHPELFTAVPDLANVRVVSEFGGFRGAAYFPDEDVIRMGADSTPERYLSTLLHEVQHAVQQRYGMNEGGSPNNFFNDLKAFKEAKSHLFSKSRDLAKIQEKQTDPELKAIVKQRQEATSAAQKKLSEADNKALNSYTRIAGEVEAYAVEKMRADGPGKKLGITYYGQDVDKLIQYPGMSYMQDDNPEVKKIIDQALNEAARTNKKAP